MLFNLILRKESYQFLHINIILFIKTIVLIILFKFLLIINTGVAWLSSARVAKCFVKSLQRA